MIKRLVAPLFLASMLMACGGDGPTDPAPLSPARVRITGGDGQAGTVGAQLPVPLGVRVEDAAGAPVPGYPVVFRVLSGGGSMASGAALTSAEGTASDRWTLGPAAGSQRVEARVIEVATGAVLAADTFTAAAGAGPGQTLSVVGSAARTGSAGLPVDSLRVRVTDAFGNPVAGHPLVWSVVSGGGTVTGSAVTDAAGIGRGAWTLGTQVGSPQVARVFAGVSLSADFTASATLPAGTTVSALSGSGQAGPVGQALADSLVVAVTLPDGRPAVGVDVQWQPGPGGGSVSPVVTRTGTDGRAAVRWTLGAGAGIQTVAALVAGSAGATFLASARAGAPVTMAAVSGGGQTGPPGQPLAAPLVVELRDGFGNPVPGWAVQWAVASGGGSVSPASSLTDAAGRAQTRWTLGAAGAAGSVTASSAGVDPVTFASPGSPVPARVSVFSGSAQSAPAGSALPNPVVARVVDAGGTPLQGVTVHWVVVSGRGVLADSVVTTDVAGLAHGEWALGPELGTSQVVEARVGGVAAAARFTATATTPDVVLSKAAGDGQTVSVDAAVPVPPTVLVTLADGRPLLGATVAWTTANGAIVDPASSTTDADGRAQTSWRLGTSALTGYTLTASSLGHSVTFTATAVPLRFAVYSGNNQQSSPFTPVPDSLVVRVTRADGTPVQGVVLQWTGSNDGSASPAASVSDAQGLARTEYTLGSPGTQLVVATAPTYDGKQVVFTERAVNPVLVKVSGDAQTARAGTALADSIRVRLTHADGRPFPGVTITFNPAPGGARPATASPPNAPTDAQGYAATRWTLGSSAGATLMTVYSSTYVISVRFTATATPIP